MVHLTLTLKCMRILLNVFVVIGRRTIQPRLAVAVAAPLAATTFPVLSSCMACHSLSEPQQQQHEESSWKTRPFAPGDFAVVGAAVLGCVVAGKLDYSMSTGRTARAPRGSCAHRRGCSVPVSRCRSRSPGWPS